MRIALLFPYFKPHFGGVETVLWEVSKRMTGHEVHVITSLLPNTREYELMEGVHVHRIQSFLPERVPYPIPKRLGLRVLAKIREINPDVLVTHNVVSWYTLLAVIAKRLYKKPLVLVMHTTDANYGVGALNTILNAYYFFSGIIRSQFDLVCAPMKNTLYRLAPDEIIPNGVDKKRFNKGDKKSARIKLNLPPDEKIVLFVGRFIPVKGVETLIKVMNSRDDVRFVLVGQGYLEERIREKTGGNVLIREPTEDVHLYYQAADACIIPSLAEGFCLTAIEATACKTPIVGSKTGILPYLTDYAFEPGDWEGMNSGLTEVLRKACPVNREYEILDWTRVAEKYVGILEEIIEKKKIVL
ncbi:MAG: glycosyltransferase family 4 protein [Candidatus Altiarchaeota archaeon]